MALAKIYPPQFFQLVQNKYRRRRMAFLKLNEWPRYLEKPGIRNGFSSVVQIVITKNVFPLPKEFEQIETMKRQLPEACYQLNEYALISANDVVVRRAIVVSRQWHNTILTEEYLAA